MKTNRELTECFKKHRKTVRNICYSYFMSPADTEDAVQNTFLRYLKTNRQGYPYYSVTKYDEQFWSFEYCSVPADGIVNEYETVRLAVNPVTGKLANLVVFYVPLPDDHEEGDVPLTQAQAEETVQTQIGAPSGFTLTGAEVRIVLPNRSLTDKYAAEGAMVYSDVTRLAWVPTYEQKGEMFDSKRVVFADYYTGEIPGGLEY